jgi:exodeoxyribonuclease VII large subunit
MEPAGRGTLREAFERLKEKLKQEGLFDESRKRKIPLLPGKIAIVTSPTGAAVKDILQVLDRRFTNAEVTIYPVKVQGKDAAREISEALASCNQRHLDDVIIVTRGGGSIEDLWPFNEEIVARALAASRIPTISAVGHEIDFTISDFVADLRAPTPSAAAEMVIESEETLLQTLTSLNTRLLSRISLILEKERNKLYQLFESTAAFVPLNLIRKSEQQMDDLEFRLRESLRYRFQSKRETLLRQDNTLRRINLLSYLQNRKKEFELRRHQFMAGMAQSIKRQEYTLDILNNRLHDLNPQRLLEKGYAICRSRSGKVIKSAAEVRMEENVNITLHRGLIYCTVSGKEEDKRTAENSSFEKGRHNHE